MKLLKYFTLFLIIVTISCNKDDSHPIIVVNNPTLAKGALREYKSGKELKINGTASDDKCMKDMYIGILDKKTKKVLFEAMPNVKDLKTFDFNETWTPSFKEETTIILKIIVNDQGDKAHSFESDIEIFI
jgi:hypothetical protein